MKSAVDDQQRLDLGQQILWFHYESAGMFGRITAPFQPIVVSNDLINVLDEAVDSLRAGSEANSWFEQWLTRTLPPMIHS